MHAQSCLTLCNSMNCSSPDSSVHGISQARILEWVAISFSRGSSWTRDWTCLSSVSWIDRRILYHWPTWEAPVTSSLASLLALIYIISMTIFRMVHHLPNPHPLPFPPRMACCSFVQLCSTLCSPMDYSLPGFSVHGILQARILEWVAISFSNGKILNCNNTFVSKC